MSSRDALRSPRGSATARRALGVTALAALAGCGVLVTVPDHVSPEHVAPGSLECEAHFGDCNHDLDDGCETDLRTDAFCGACDHHCSNGVCNDGDCVCNDHFADCDGDPTNGCEVGLQSDASSCG